MRLSYSMVTSPFSAEIELPPNPESPVLACRQEALHIDGPNMKDIPVFWDDVRGFQDVDHRNRAIPG